MSDDKVVSLTGRPIGDGVALSVSDMLDSIKSIGYQQIVLIGADKEGHFHIHASHGSRETLWALEHGKDMLLFRTNGLREE